MENVGYNLSTLGISLVTVTVTLQIGHGTLSVVSATTLPVVVTAVNTAKNVVQNETATVQALEEIKSTSISAIKTGLQYGSQSLNIFLSIIPVVAILGALILVIAMLVGTVQGFQRPVAV